MTDSVTAIDEIFVRRAEDKDGLAEMMPELDFEELMLLSDDHDTHTD